VQDLKQTLTRRRDALGRHLAYRFVRHGVANLELSRTIACPCCGYLTLTEQGYDFCGICRWFDDGQDDAESDEVWPGPNSPRSLTYGRERFVETYCSLSPDDKDFHKEQMLIDAKRSVIEVFEKLAGAVSMKEAFTLLQRADELLRELRRERARVFDA
jgi:hypothetical protein